MGPEIERQAAILLLARLDLRELGADARASIVSDWWTLDSEDAEWAFLSPEAQCRLVASDKPDGDSAELDSLVLVGLRAQYFGVRNEWIRNALLTRVGIDVNVIGQAERMYRCPCCSYFSLSREKEHAICRVCYWQDDGTHADSELSSANGMTLGEGKSNFATLGACSPSARPRVDPAARMKYTNSNEQ